MTINYTCLGKGEKIRERRFQVLNMFLKGAKPKEIAEQTGLTIRQVYNDILFLRTNPLHDLPVDMVRDFGKSFYELKITELERKLKKNESNPSVWLGIQKLIKDYKDASLKIQGASIEKIEHVGNVTHNHKLNTYIADDPKIREQVNGLLKDIAKHSGGVRPFSK